MTPELVVLCLIDMPNGYILMIGGTARACERIVLIYLLKTTKGKIPKVHIPLDVTNSESGPYIV